ncbi:MAG: hypothetical protein WAW37_17565 [Syntrophobacteraceae bacterium]
MIATSVEDTKNHYEKLLQKFRAAVHKECKTRDLTNIEELLARLLTEQPDLKALTAKIRDKKGHVLKKAEIDRDYLRKIIAREIKSQYD